MTDRRLERLRQIDAAATAPPWRSDYFIADPKGRAECEAAAMARNILPATIELLEGVLALHSDIHGHGECGKCWKPWPCRNARDALAVLDRIGDGDG